MALQARAVSGRGLDTDRQTMGFVRSREGESTQSASQHSRESESTQRLYFVLECVGGA